MPGDNYRRPRSIELRRFKARGHLILAEHDMLKCAISEISDGSATLVIEAERELPPEFVLEFEGNVVVSRICRLVSQSGYIVEVSFPFRNPHPHKRNEGLL